VNVWLFGHPHEAGQVKLRAALNQIAVKLGIAKVWRDWTLQGLGFIDIRWETKCMWHGDMVEAYMPVYIRQFTGTYRDKERPTEQYQTDGWVRLSVAVDIVRPEGRPSLMTRLH